MEAEKIIAEIVDRLQKSGRDAVNSIEENKEGDGEKVKRRQMVDWCGLAA